MPHARSKLTVVLSIALGVAAPVGVLIAAASASVNARRVPNSTARSIGVAVALVHTPCRSGVPSARRGG